MPKNGSARRPPQLGRALGALGALAAALGCVLLLSPAAQAAPKADASVVGGGATTTAEWPYQVAVLRRDLSSPTDYERQLCAGAVLTPTLILSAAHCVMKTSPPLVPAQLQVLIGRTQLSSVEGQTFDVSNYYLFGFNAPTQQNDVMLIDISPASTTAPRVKLPGPDERTLWDAKSPAYVTGWGATAEGGPRSDVLQEAFMRMIADSSCASPEVYGGLLDSASMVCAGYLAGGVDSCQGDSGGPLSVPARHGQWRLAGTVSFGDGCARKNRPGVYARLGDNPLRGALQGFVNTRPDAVNIIGSGGSMPCNPTIAGTERRDKLKGAKGPDVIDGLGGRDVISGKGGKDVLCGDEHEDVLKGGLGDDIIRGGPGSDFLQGGSGDDLLIGGGGNDVLIGGRGSDRLKGGGGKDRERR